MRRPISWRALLLVALLAAALIAAGCGGDDDDDGGTTADLGLIKDGTLTVGSDIPFPPFEQGDPPDYEGFDIDMANEIATRLELETTIKDLPFDLILQGGKGRFDVGIAATTITDEREEQVDFSDPYFVAEQSLLVRADGDVQSAADLAGKKIGVQDATTGETYAQDNLDADEVRPFPETDDAYNALIAGQVDAVVNDLPSTQSVAEEKGDLEVVEVFETGEEYGLVFAQGAGASCVDEGGEVRPCLIDEINAALQEIKDDGTLDELYMKWFDKEAPESVKSATHIAT